MPNTSASLGQKECSEHYLNLTDKIGKTVQVVLGVMLVCWVNCWPTQLSKPASICAQLHAHSYSIWTA